MTTAEGVELAEMGEDNRLGAEPALSLAGLVKRFGSGATATLALDGLDLEVAQGEFVCLAGASGCGKSTLLNLIAGLDSPTRGTVETHAHRVALMFQEAALFPWLTARGNIEMALRLAGVRRQERRERAEALLAQVRLAGMGERRPHELSGGMRQRVALARALAQGADILLMDEPFAALDAMTRDALHDELERVWQESGLTVLFVTHNVREAARLGDRVVLLTSRPGRIAAEFPIDVPRPRRIDSVEISEVARGVTDRLWDEVRRHGA